MQGSIYLVVSDFDRSVDFYTRILGGPPESANSRFAMFSIPGLCLCLLNGYFDALYPELVEKPEDSREYPMYDDLLTICDSENTRKVFINLYTQDLAAEYERIASLGIAENMTEIRYLNVYSPYWYFTFTDPDGNPVEIAGEYDMDGMYDVGNMDDLDDMELDY